jgi:hypothetical protein
MPWSSTPPSHYTNVLHAVKKKITRKEIHGEIYLHSLATSDATFMLDSDADLGIHLRVARWIALLINPFINLLRILYSGITEDHPEDTDDG